MSQPLRILLIDDEEIVHETIGPFLRDLGCHVDHLYDGRDGLRRIESSDYDLALMDVRMPGINGLSLLREVRETQPKLPCVIITGHASLDTAIEALRSGAVDFLLKPVDLLYLEAMLERMRTVRQLQEQSSRLRETIGAIQTSENERTRRHRFVGVSDATREVHAQVRGAIESKCDTLLITGETGTGKEVAARELHFGAYPEERPFIAVSCPALPDSLIESELFGHVKGSFTGATTDRAGYFELADEGTLFLDEVADLSSSAQAALLRVLETRSFRRVGGSEEITVNVRIIAATNAPLDALVATGKFRQDLFYRLNVYNIHLLPLRERRDDIIPLAEHFLSVYTETRGLEAIGLSTEAEDLLRSYDFPGNARELRNMVERAAVICRSNLILPKHLSLPELSGEQVRVSVPRAGQDDEAARILSALEQTKWNRRRAAENLGMSYSSLRRKMQKLGIK